MWHINSRIIFIFGFLTGSIISILFQNKNSESIKLYSTSQEVNFIPQYTRKHVSFDILRYGNYSYSTESDVLFKSITILCLILVTKDKNLQSIRGTWGLRCNSIETVYLNKTRSIFPLKTAFKSNTWNELCDKMKKAPKDFKWILVANDDTYVIVDNLRYYLRNKNSSDNFYIGRPVKLWGTNYNLGKAGYVISRGVINTIQDSSCDNGVFSRNKEDFILGNHLKTFNISVMDTKDDHGLSLFHAYNLNRLLFPVDNHKFEYVYETKCCSRFTITFNAMDADKMYTYHYMLYTLQLFYEGNLGNRPPDRPSEATVWKKFLKDRHLPSNISNEDYYKAWDRLIDSSDVFGRNMKREDYSDLT